MARTRRAERQAGFTLIEVLIVVAILGIIAGIAVASLMNALDKAKQRATMADMRAIAKAIEIYGVDTGHYPDTGGDMDALRNVLIPVQSNVVPVTDHWAHTYQYQCSGTTEYTLVSLGKDGVDGPDISVGTRFDFTRDIVLANGIFVASPE